jgi:hypothetical protein
MTYQNIKTEIAKNMGYPNWKEYFDWISRNKEYPLVVAQQMEAICTEAAELWQVENLKRIAELEMRLKKAEENADSRLAMNMALNDRIEVLEEGLKSMGMDSKVLIEGSQERFHELKDYDFDWKSFYTGWIESRVKVILKAKQLLKIP